jgi:hypothetical protein
LQWKTWRVKRENYSVGVFRIKVARKEAAIFLKSF